MSKRVNFRTIATKISVFHKELVSDNREYFLKLLEILLCLTKQGLPLCGHNEWSEYNNKGNYLELCVLFTNTKKKKKNRSPNCYNFTHLDRQNERLQIVREDFLITYG